jgi:non-ribosomal peptide synthetase component F
MSNSEQLDLCIGIVVMNRSQNQLQNMIGFFVNTLPFYLKINPYESFAQLCHRIQQLWLDILPHSHLPYQEIAKLDQNMGSSLLQTVFQVETVVDSQEQNIDFNEGTTFSIIPRKSLTSNVAKFDMTCALYENRQNETISVSLNASLDVYDKSMIATMANRFKNIFDQLISISSLYQFSLLLPHELQLMHGLNNTICDYGEIGCIHWEFASQACLHPQKVAVELDDQSLTYSELLYYAQMLSLNLLNNHGIVSCDIICQCMEPSLSMVS